jgi:hypothetical protein
MIAVFYQRTPEVDTPYKELILKHDQTKGWVVRLFAGTKWWPKEESTVEREDLVKDWDEGKTMFDQVFNEVVNSGWRLYTPQEDFRPPSSFQTEVRR